MTTTAIVGTTQNQHLNILQTKKNVKDIVKEEISYEKKMYQLEQDYANGKITKEEYNAEKLLIGAAHKMQSASAPNKNPISKSTRELVQDEISHQKELYKLEQKYENGEIKKPEYTKQKIKLEIKHSIKNILNGNLNQIMPQEPSSNEIIKKEVEYYKNKMKLDAQLEKGEITKEEYNKKMMLLEFKHTVNTGIDIPGTLVMHETQNNPKVKFSTTA